LEAELKTEVQKNREENEVQTDVEKNSGAHIAPLIHTSSGGQTKKGPMEKCEKENT